MKKPTDKLQMIILLIKEYMFYLRTEPELVWNIPRRLWEEFSLHVRYIFAKITGSSKNKKLIQDLHMLSYEMEQADSVYKPSLLWKDLYEQFERVLHVEDISAFKTQRYNRRFSAFSPHDIIIYKMFLWLYYQNIEQRDSLKLLGNIEEPIFGKADTYEIRGKRISHDLMQSLDEFYAIYPYVTNKKKHLVVAELGAGYGRLGYVFLNALQNSTYIIIDLPGSLIIAQHYMKTVFPKEKILTFQKNRTIKKLDRKTMEKYRIICLAPWQLPILEDNSLDIFVNIYSFQEMTHEQVNNYFALIDKKCRGLFYTKQYYESDNPKDEVTIDLKDYPFYKNWKKLFLKTSTIHQLNFEALFKI